MDLPKEGKLVRDRIPDVMRAAGAQPRVTALSPDQILPALLSKLNEEVNELSMAANRDDVIGELADVAEVLWSIASTWAINWAEVALHAGQKRDQRGGFEAGLWLLGTGEDQPS